MFYSSPAVRVLRTTKTRMASFISKCLLFSAFVSAHCYAQGTWTQIATHAPDNNAGVMLLLNDGSVLVKAGGGGTVGTGWDRLWPDIHGSYVNGSWTTAAGMADSRLYFSSHVLKNGLVYVAGGEYGTGRSKAEIYSPIDDMWFPTVAPVTDPTDTISDANSAMLPDGRILQAVVLTGHSVSRHTYIYDPVTSTFTPGPNTLGIDDETSWTKLPDNSILFADLYASTTERYIPATNTWIHDADIPLDLYDAYGYEAGASFILPDGRAFFLGSTSTSAYYTPSGNTTPGTWAVGPVIPDSLGAPDAAAAMMPNGKILCAFSPTPTNDTVFYPKTKFFEFDYLTNTFTHILTPQGHDSASFPSYMTNMLMLPDGSVLYSTQNDNKYYVYTPGGTPLAAGKPTVNNVYTDHCDTFTATGTLFNGISEGASYGDDWQMATNYPIVRLSRHDSVFYASTYNWNSTGLMRGTAPDTTQFVLPLGLDPGTYQLQVVANGIASDPYSFTFCHTAGVSTVNKPAKKLNIFPNPASDEVTIEYNALHAGEYNIILTDVMGRKVVAEQHTAVTGKNINTINLTGIAPGIYNASLIDGNNIYAEKVIVK